MSFQSSFHRCVFFLSRYVTALLCMCVFTDQAQAAVQVQPGVGGYVYGSDAVFTTKSDYANYFCAHAAYNYNSEPGQFTGQIQDVPTPSNPAHPQFYYWCTWASHPGSSMQYGPSLSWGYGCAESQTLSSTPQTCATPPSKPPQICPSSEGGNPINLATQEKKQPEHDYASAHGLEFNRYYSSLRVQSPTLQSVDWIAPGWRHTYSKRLVSSLMHLAPPANYFWDYQLKRWLPDPQDTANNFAYLVLPNGYVHYFVSLDAGASWQSDSDVTYKLNSQMDSNGNVISWKLTTPQDDVETYDPTGKLVSIAFRSGQSQTLTYSDATTPANIAPSPGLLIKVADNFGAVLAFQYDASNRLVQMTDPNGQLYSYAYDSNNNLVSVTYPTGLKRQYLYNEPAYQASTLPNALHFLTGMADEISAGNIIRYATFQYDAQGRPVSTEHAGGVYKYTFDYTANAITDPLGATRQYNLSTVNGVKLETSVSQPGGAGCSASSGGFAYDDNGNITTRTDWNGNQTTYTYDLTRNLETSRTEASGTAQARTISTQWHAMYRLPTMIAEPKKLTTYTYDSSGNLLTRTEQATTDASGVQGFGAAVVGTPRTWTYTYNSLGQVLTITGPRTDVVDKTAYAYDTSGNLITVTDAAGKVTTLSNYDANGRVGHLVDPNGLTTDLTYSPRGWLLQKTVSGNGSSQTTGYTYDGVGQLTQVTTPDSTLTYTYDAAHRLTDISDALGNTIHYTLDAMGNRTAEQTKDVNGNLARQITRVYDALNRLQQVTGGAQ